MKKQNKLFVIKKYIWAKNAQEALKEEHKHKADDCWIDEEFKRNLCNPKNTIEFYEKN